MVSKKDVVLRNTEKKLFMLDCYVDKHGVFQVVGTENVDDAMIFSNSLVPLVNKSRFMNTLKEYGFDRFVEYKEH